MNNLTNLDINPVYLCSQALIMLGALPINSFDEGSVESEVASTLFATIYNRLLSASNWSFSEAQACLQNPQARDISGKYSYSLPYNLLRLQSVGYHDPKENRTDYELVGKWLKIDSQKVAISYFARVDCSDLPDWFIYTVVTTLASEFCLPITGSPSRTNELRAIALKALEDAKLLDKRQEPNKSLDAGYELIDVR